MPLTLPGRSTSSTPAGRLQRAVHERPLTVFVVLTITLSWVFWVPSALLFAGAPDPDRLLTSPLFVLLQTLGAATPTLVALGLVRLLEGRAGLRRLGRRFRPTSRTLRWAAPAALTAPVLAFVAMAVDALLRGGPLVDPRSGLAEMAASLGWVAALGLLPVVLVSQLVSSPLLEEAGWRGFALPRLQARWDALTASLVLGLVWGVWHLPLVIAYGDRLGPYLLGIVSYTVLMTWVFNSGGGDLALMLLFHASINTSLNVLLPHPSAWLPAGVVAVAALVVVLVLGPGDLSRRGRYTGAVAAADR